jgi:hypothetical protein
MNYLPLRLHELLDLALKDLMSCAKSTKYVIDMGTWHEPYRDGCHVCMAGAVMARSLGQEAVQLQPRDLPGNENQLSALNRIRLGNFKWARGLTTEAPYDVRSLYKMYEDLGGADALSEYPRTKHARAKWWAAWRKIQKEMERLGV